MFADVVAALRDEAQATNERRVLVLSGPPADTRDAAADALDAAEIPLGETTLLGPEPSLGCERFSLARSGDLLGRTRSAVVVALHEACRPNAIGRAVGAVDGGGLLLLLTPSLDEWSTRRDEFDETLAAPPATIEDVAGNFRSRLVDTLRAHRAIAVVDAGDRSVVDDGLTRPAPACAVDDTDEVSTPADASFPSAVYEACLTGDQVSAVNAFESLRDGGALVVEADRGRGKSSAAGLAAGILAHEGKNVLVTAPAYRNAGELLSRARALLDVLGAETAPTGEQPRELLTDDGWVRFAPASEASEQVSQADIVVVDEAAALPVRVLEGFLDAPAVAFTTTIRGYEGAGRGFSVRFRDRLVESDHEVTEISLDTPIRYAAGDPVEVWAFRALLLDARPPVDEVISQASPDSVAYEQLTPAALLADEQLLREVFGLLVLAHYRTEPDDLARLLDAPNVTVRALTHDGHVVSVALLAREGNLSAERRAGMYDGERIRGNMLPDVLTTQLRDESAGVPVGMRVLRIATQHSVRSRGLGSKLLREIRREFADDVDWLGVGFGATPELLDFWAGNGYRPVHLSTTRNDRSGEYSALLIDPTSDRGTELVERHESQFLHRVGGVLGDPLADADPDVVRATLRATTGGVDPDLADWEWRHVASAAFGPGLFDMHPSAYRDLVVAALADGSQDSLTDRQERLLVSKTLQTRPWDDVAATLDYHSTAECMRALGDALEPLVDEYGTAAAQEEADRYR